VCTCIPYLCFYRLVFCLNALCRKLDTNRTLGFQIELVPRESREQVGLAYAGVSDQNDLEEVIIVIVIVWLRGCHLARCEEGC